MKRLIIQTELFVRNLYMTICLAMLCSVAEGQVQGRVVSQSSGEPLKGATVVLIPVNERTVTDAEGRFSLGDRIGSADSLEVVFIGYRHRSIALTGYDGTTLEILLAPDEVALEEVRIVNTGYQSLPRERATGSFEVIDNKLLNRSIGPDILSRLDGVASGVQFVNPNGTNASDIRVRGLGTIESNETPLVILDNFPYEGDISNINPNDVESVTVLRDAAAASIWGARAGNGVIVITTKRGKYGQRTNVSANANVTIGGIPNLFYSPQRLSSSEVMAIEREIYEHGGYAMSERTPLPAYVELLIRLEDGLISEEDFLQQERVMQTTEIRREVMDHLYRNSVGQQYAAEASGGHDTYRYMMSFGYDRNRSNMVGNHSDRLNIRTQNTFRPAKNLELSGGMRYVLQRASNDGLPYSNLETGNVNNQYLRLMADDGQSMPVVKDYRWDYVSAAADDGLLDWYYRPLDEIKLNRNSSRTNELLLTGEASYSINRAITLKSQYQYGKSASNTDLYHDPASYYVRNLVNRFTQADGSRVIPHGGILRRGSPEESSSHSIRAQLDIDHARGIHRLNGIIGAEARQHVLDIYQGYWIYDFDDDLYVGTNQFDFSTMFPTRPAGRARIPSTNANRQQYMDRYLSYFGNMGYRVWDRYTLSLSGRWDGSNLFGVKTNQKGRLLWSVGTTWDVHEEKFFSSRVMPQLRFRVTYGSSGNVNKSVSHYPTIRLGYDDFRGTLAQITSIGNPSLRWEQVITFNAGMDFRFFDRIDGNLEYYVKSARDLIGNQLMPPSSGLVGDYKINYANLSTRGVDLRLTTSNLQGDWHWQSHFLVSYVSNEVTNYNTGDVNGVVHYINSAPPPVVGRSRDVVYALPWHGLDPQTGFPIVYILGEQSTDYARYYASRTPDDLLVKGVWVPPFHGSLRNELSWRGLSLSILLTWKAGHVFRRSSISSGQEFYGIYHLDYYNRWKEPGDEKYTDVPAAVGMGQEGALQSAAYNFSEALIEPGAHIRLRDVNLSYSLDGNLIGRLPVSNMRLLLYMRNMGLIWKQSALALDPDFAEAEFKPPFSMAVGLQIGF